MALMLIKLTALAVLFGSISLGGHALACPERANEAIVRSDSILSKYKQIFRERKAVIQGSASFDKRQACSLTRQLAELEREWLDNNNIIKNICPSFYSYLKSGSDVLDASLFENNYEVNQGIIGLCAQKGL